MYKFQDAGLFKRELHPRLMTAGLLAMCCLHNTAHALDCKLDAPPQLLNQSLILARVAACNRDVVNAQRLVTASQADLRVAGQAPNPSLTVGVGSVNPNLGVGAGPYWDKTVDNSIRYEQLIERGGKRELRSQSAEQLLKAAQQDALDVERQQDVIALQAMVDLDTADKRVKLLTEVSALYEETLRANTRRTVAGDLAPVDAERQALDLTRAQIDLRQAQLDAVHARTALAGLLAWESQASALQVDPKILDSAPLPADQFDPVERADIKASRLRTQAALSLRDLAKAQSSADVTAGLQLDHWPTSSANHNGTGDTFSVSLSIPLMLRHHFEGELARATSDSQAAEETLQRIEASAQADWTRINAEVSNAEARLNILQTVQMPRAVKIAQSIEIGYSKGAISVLDLLDARRLLLQTRLDLLAARADRARAVIARNRWITSASASF